MGCKTFDELIESYKKYDQEVADFIAHQNSPYKEIVQNIQLRLMISTSEIAFLLQHLTMKLLNILKYVDKKKVKGNEVMLFMVMKGIMESLENLKPNIEPMMKKTFEYEIKQLIEKLQSFLK
jgi:hypothetical protein